MPIDRTLFLSNLAAQADNTVVGGLLRTDGAGNITAPAGFAITGAGYNTPATLTDAATIAWDWSVAQSAMVTIGANRVLANPTNAVSGQYSALRVARTGAYVLSFDTLYKGVSSISQSATNGLVDHFVFRYNGTNFELVSFSSSIGA